MLARSPFFVSISQNINDHINLFSALCFPSEFHVKLRLETLRMRRFQLKCVCLRSGWTEPPVSGRSTIRTSQCFHTAGFQVVGRATTGGCQEHEAPPFVFFRAPPSENTFLVETFGLLSSLETDI